MFRPKPGRNQSYRLLDMPVLLEIPILIQWTPPNEKNNNNSETIWGRMLRLFLIIVCLGNFVSKWDNPTYLKPRTQWTINGVYAAYCFSYAFRQPMSRQA